MDTKQDKHGMSVDFIDVFEFDVALRVQKESLSPKRNEGYYCQEMITNRLVLPNTDRLSLIVGVLKTTWLANIA